MLIKRWSFRPSFNAFKTKTYKLNGRFNLYVFLYTHAHNIWSFISTNDNIKQYGKTYCLHRCHNT